MVKQGLEEQQNRAQSYTRNNFNEIDCYLLPNLITLAANVVVPTTSGSMVDFIIFFEENSIGHLTNTSLLEIQLLLSNDLGSSSVIQRDSQLKVLIFKHSLNIINLRYLY